jgi:dTDP-4-dehydrorhamnose 3,5-epimerase
MKVINCELDGLLIIEPDVYGDQRGFFLESWNRQRYVDAGINVDFVQDNFSFSQRGTLRGLHFQNPLAQGKLVSVWQGEVFDVAVDIRRQSRTFGRWYGTNLTAGNKRQFYIPPGFAHGFAVVSETALFHYKCTEIYAPRNELGFRWDDPDVGIKWPLPAPILSQRDAHAPFLRELPVDKLF